MNEQIIDNKPSAWTKDHENILIDWADKAMCYRWLHAKANQKFKKLNALFTVPVIIMSTITGTANFASEKIPIEYRSYYSSIIGGVNIIAGIITTVQQFLKISELNEAHRVSSITWDKFYRKIRVELAKPPNERQNVYDFLKACTEEFDRLMEISPMIDKHIIKKFQDTFQNKRKVSSKARDMFEKLKKPEICDVLESVRFSIFKEDVSIEKERKLKNVMKDVASSLDDEENYSKKFKLLDEYYSHFKTELMREPTKEELHDNFIGEGTNIDASIIDKFMKKRQINLKHSLLHGAVDIEMGIEMNAAKMANNMQNMIQEQTQIPKNDSLAEIDNYSESTEETAI